MASLEAREAAGDSKTEKKSGWSLGESVSEFASSLSAGVTGAVTFSLVSAAVRATPWGAVAAIPLAMMSGGATKFGVKWGLEHALVDEKDRTSGLADLAWGAVDGAAGVSASWADRQASRMFLDEIAKDKLGPNMISSVTAQMSGKQLVHDNVYTGINHSLMRGMAGGFAGSFTWSVPHRIYENWDQLRDHTAQGALSTTTEVLKDTGSGLLLGGVLSAAGTAVMRSNELVGSAGAAMRNDPNTTPLRLLHINDLHSHNDQLAGMKVLSDRLLADAKQKGMPSQFVAAGDMEASNVQYRPEKAGMPENSSLMKMGVRKFIPGNHPYDSAGGHFDVPPYVRTMTTLMHDNPDASLIATNLEFPGYPEYANLAKKYTIDTIAGPNGPEKVATLGLITHEGTELSGISGIKYNDAKESAVKTMLDLSKQHGVNKFVILSHLGLGEDEALAQALVKDGDLSANNLKVAAIIGGHSHDVTAAPIWMGRSGPSTGGLSTWKNLRGGGYEIPIVQAGSAGRWLGQLDLAIRPDGSADPYRTVGKMHPITHDMPKDDEINNYVNSQMSEIMALRQTDYNTRVLSNLTIKGLRRRESELGNMVSDAVDKEVKPDAVLTQSSWINNQLASNIDKNGKVFRPITREDVANLFKNAGDPEQEKAELGVFKIRGTELRNILEHGVRDYPPPPSPTLAQKVVNVFSSRSLNPWIDEPGNFLQVAGLKYQFDFSKTPITSVKFNDLWRDGMGDGNRVGNIWMRDRSSGQYLPLDPHREYSIAARHHIFEKWQKFGIFGDRTVEETPVNKSPVEMVGNLIRNRDIEPSTFRREGRIIDLTPKVPELPLKVGPSIFTAPLLSGKESQQNK